MLARQPKEVAGSADIVGGLPRVTEVFEARTPQVARPEPPDPPGRWYTGPAAPGWRFSRGR